MKNPYRWVIYMLILVSLIGIADAGYLSYTALTDTPVACKLIEGCNVVAKSPYSNVWGVPLALYGLFFYFVALVGSLMLLANPSRTRRVLAVLWGIAGVLFSAYFTYLQAYVIGAFCIYCLISAAATLMIFVLTLGLLGGPHGSQAQGMSPAL